MRSPRLDSLPFSACAIALLGLSACGAEPREIDTRAVVIGIDGVDWKLVDELAARGQIPNLMRLRERGAALDDGCGGD